jgi:hypothetical protein
MSWYRVQWKGTDIRFPEVCPNCLQGPANVPIRVERSLTALRLTLPFHVGRVTRLDWPHCRDCVDYHFKKRSTYVRSAWLCVGACVAASYLAEWTEMLGMISKGNTVTAAYILWLTFTILTVAWFVIRIRRMAGTKCRTTTGYAVEPIHLERDESTHVACLEVVFANPFYAKAFVERNTEGAELQFDRRELDQAMIEWRTSKRTPRG